MRKTIHKWFWAWSFEKEEQWLNHMAAKGLALVAVGFCTYTFEECTPGEYKVRMELLEEVPTHAESQQYLNFLEDTGVEYLGAITRWVYLRKKDGEFDLFSDNASRIAHLNRILTLLGMVGGMNILGGASTFANYFYLGKIGLYVGLVNLCLGIVIAYGFVRLYLKRRNLKKQHTLFE